MKPQKEMTRAMLALLALSTAGCVAFDDPPPPQPIVQHRPTQPSLAQQFFKGIARMEVEHLEETRERMRIRAANGDAEAQQWLDNNSSAVDGMRQIYDEQERREEAQYPSRPAAL